MKTSFRLSDKSELSKLLQGQINGLISNAAPVLLEHKAAHLIEGPTVFLLSVGHGIEETVESISAAGCRVAHFSMISLQYLIYTNQ